MIKITQKMLEFMKKMELTLEVHENILEFKTNTEVDIKA